MKILLFLIFISVVYCQNTKVLTRIFTEKQLNEIYAKNIKASLIYTYSPSNYCESCLRDIESLTTNLEGIVKSYIIYCDDKEKDNQNLEICKNFSKKLINLPEVSLIEPTQSKQYKKHVLKIEEISFKFIKALVTKLSPLYSQTLNSYQDLQDFLKESEHGFNKVLYFHKNLEIPLLYKGLTSEYKDRLQFAHCKFNLKEVIDFYQITDFPALLLLKRNRLKENEFFKFEFKNKYNMTNLVKFLNKYAFPQKIKFHSAPATQEVKNYLFKYEEFEEEWNDIQEINFNATLGFNQFVKEKISLVHITNGKTPFPIYSQIIERMSNSLTYFSMNCTKKPDNSVFAEHKLKVRNFPSIILFYYNKTVLINTTLPISLSFNEALKTISDLIIDNSNRVSSEDNLEFYLTKSFEEDKIAVVLFHDSDVISVSFRTFGYLSKYKPYFRFINFKNAPENIKTKYGVKKIPKILAIVQQSFINSEGGTLIVGYEGVFIYHQMAKFLHHVLIKYRGDDLNNLVIKLENKKMFEDLCLSEKHLFCLIGFLNPNEKTKRNANSSFKKYLETLKKLRSQFHEIYFQTLWVNVTCHRKVVENFDLDNQKLPQAVLYYKANSKFTTWRNDFSFEQLSSFIMKFLKTPNELTFYYGTSEMFKVLNSKCDDQVAKFKTKDEL